MKSKYLVGITAAIMTLIVIGVAMTPALAVAVDNWDPDLAMMTPGDKTVVISTDMYGTTRVENVMWGKNGWSDEIFVLTVTEPQTWFSVHLYDRFWVGDFYELWEISPIGEFKGVTPEVETDWHHGSATYPCPVGNPIHTGTGTVYSDATFTIVKEPGTYKYMVRNAFFDVLISEGLDPTSPPWSPAGFYIGFHYTNPVPELPWTVPLITSLIVIVLVPLKRKLWNK